jgi:hypothetical protein
MADLFEFTPAELEDRFVDHFKLARDYADAIGQEFNVSIGISKRRLYLTIISAYEDIARYKNYHLDDPFHQKSDAIKRASYLTKWICRFKPLVVQEGTLDDIASANIDKTLIVNELFALHLAAVHLSVDAKRNFIISEIKSYEIAYEMMFRHLSEDSYLLVFQMIMDHVTKGKDIVQLF